MNAQSPADLALLNRWRSLCQEVLTPSVKLLVVSKAASIEAVALLAKAGQHDFGENTWQTAQKKITQLSNLNICWHFIGRLQSNKCAVIARHFDWVHTLSRLDHAVLLAKARLGKPPLRVCLQVNFSSTRDYGVAPEAVFDLAQSVLQMPELELCGLMTLPLPGDTSVFELLAPLRDQLEKACGKKLPTLSMGMSEDYRAAIKAGATWVRVGSLIFG